jgi:Flp pilus assembly pilin Flp
MFNRKKEKVATSPLGKKKSGLLKNQKGLSTVEYIILLVLIAVIAIGTWKRFGGAVEKHVSDASDAVESMDSSGSTTSK